MIQRNVKEIELHIMKDVYTQKELGVSALMRGQRYRTLGLFDQIREYEDALMTLDINTGKMYPESMDDTVVIMKEVRRNWFWKRRPLQSLRAKHKTYPSNIPKSMIQRICQYFNGDFDGEDDDEVMYTGVHACRNYTM